MVATSEADGIRSAGMGSERGVGACEAKGAVRTDTARLFGIEASARVVKSVLCKLVHPRVRCWIIVQGCD